MRKSLEMAQTFTADIVKRAIKSCRNSKLNIFYLTHLGPRAIKYTTPFNLLVTTDQIPAVWKSLLIIPIPNTGNDTVQGTSYWSISLLLPAVKVMETLLLPTINKYLLPVPDLYGFKQKHTTTSGLLQLTTDIEMGFTQRKLLLFALGHGSSQSRFSSSR